MRGAMSFSIIVHGGAGDLGPNEDGRPAQQGCLAAARAGYAVLQAGGSALDAAIEAVRVMEDDPVFNAGTGSVLTLDGEVETDASVMTGEGGAGAVAALRDVKNPVLLARRVMEKTPHVLLAGDGARAFAVEQGFTLLPPGALVTEAAKAKWKRLLDKRHEAKPGGTVGAVARDREGKVAAATSTGGTPLKMRGRVGDTPLIGAGTYAHCEAGAVSCTGIGESIIKAVLGYRMTEGMRGGTPIPALATELVEELKRFGGHGGLIAVNAEGEVGHAFNTQRMARAWIDREGRAFSGFAPGDDRES